ncbi:hypothetical protein ACUIHB_20115 [Aeromonas veronii]|uniref:hypothetical protein n=1 Tax=Aeromonas veronii TaxID=654 RepID=UPI00403DEB32
MANIITGLTSQTQHLMFCDFYAILARNHNVTREMVRPLSFREISKKIGEKAAFLMLSLLDNPNCSKEAIEAVVEVIHSLAGENGIYASSLHVTEVNNGIRGLLGKTTKEDLRIGGFSLHTRGFLNTDLEQLEEISCKFIFTPEYKSPKSLFEDGARGIYSFDLKIDFILEREQGKDKSAVTMATVIAEYDGPTHLMDEQVRKDKARDSSVQSTGATVFRIQTPHKERKQSEYKQALSETKIKTIGDIKEFFRNTLYKHFEVSNLISGNPQRDENGRDLVCSFINKK